jgi:hypothetical protein
MRLERATRRGPVRVGEPLFPGFEEMMDMDLYYVNHKSLLLDLSIIARTIPAVVQQVIDQQRKKIELRRPVIRGGGIRSFSRGSRD